MELVQIAGLLLFVMLLLLAGGVWIAMTLAIVGWIGRASCRERVFITV